MKKQNKFLLLLIGLLLFGIIFLVISLTKDVGKSTIAKSMEGPIKELDALYKTVKVKDYQVQRSNAIVSDEKIAILPDISEYPFVVNPTTDSYITIYSSLDKANEDYNAWLCKVADNFNKSFSRYKSNVK